MDTLCKCSLDGERGYCGEILGIAEHKTAIEMYKTVLQEAACHTMDRNNLRAFLDPCGNAASNADSMY